MSDKEYLQHIYLCQKEVTAEVTILVDDNASEEDIQKMINRELYNDDIEWDYYGTCKIIEELDVRAVSEL